MVGLEDIFQPEGIWQRWWADLDEELDGIFFPEFITCWSPALEPVFPWNHAKKEEMCWSSWTAFHTVARMATW